MFTIKYFSLLTLVYWYNIAKTWELRHQISMFFFQQEQETSVKVSQIYLTSI